MSRTICLQGEPGSGKSKMACETAVNKPVHCIDVDRKILSAAWAAPLIASGELTVQEVNEPIDETNLVSRMRALTTEITKKGPTTMPQGWQRFYDIAVDLPKKPESKAAGTWLIDSATHLNEHLKAFIMYCAGRSKFTFDQWNALKIGWMDTFSFLRDIARENGKDLIFTVHERFKEEPGDRTTGVKVETVASGEGLSQVRTYQGTQDIKIWASIDGAFGDLIGSHCDEYYWLYVEMQGEKPVWRCRVHPEGRRSLRTSFMLDKSVFEPDFRKIWK